MFIAYLVVIINAVTLQVNFLALPARLLDYGLAVTRRVLVSHSVLRFVTTLTETAADGLNEFAIKAIARTGKSTVI